MYFRISLLQFRVHTCQVPIKTNDQYNNTFFDTGQRTGIYLYFRISKSSHFDFLTHSISTEYTISKFLAVSLLPEPATVSNELLGVGWCAVDKRKKIYVIHDYVTQSKYLCICLCYSEEGNSSELCYVT